MERKMLWEGATEGSINWMGELLLLEGRYFLVKETACEAGGACQGSC